MSVADPFSHQRATERPRIDAPQAPYAPASDETERLARLRLARSGNVGPRT